MKNVIIVLLIVFWAWYFYNLGQNNKWVEDAKREMWVISDEKLENKEIKNKEVVNQEVEKLENKEVVKATYKVNKLDEKNLIEIDDLIEKVERISDKIKITWKVFNKNVDKIVIKFKNKTSNFPNDTYTLWKFKKWNDTFEYNADSKFFRNLDYGLNEYLIEAYIWEESSKISVEINIPTNMWESSKVEDEQLSEKVTYDKKMVWEWDEALYLGMPSSELFWKPLNVWDWEVTYSNIDNLKIIKEKLNKDFLKSSNIWKKDWTGYISKNAYWHIFTYMDYNNKDVWVNFFVLRATEDKVIYEKHYLDYKHSLKWILKIKEFDRTDWNVYKQMEKLNSELKKESENYKIVKTTDKLFKEIVN